MKVEFHPEAEEEFVEEASYYEEQVTALGASFIGELESATTFLEEHPKLGAEFDKPFSHFPMQRFPHSLIYTIEPSRVWVSPLPIRDAGLATGAGESTANRVAGSV